MSKHKPKTTKRASHDEADHDTHETAPGSEREHDVEHDLGDELSAESSEAAEEQFPDHDEDSYPDQASRQAHVTPSWFATEFNANDKEHLAARYREARNSNPRLRDPTPESYEVYRRRLEERFQSAKRVAMAPAPAMSTMRHDEPPPRNSHAPDDDGNLRFRDWQKKVQARQAQASAAKAPPAARRGRLSPVRIAGLFAAACSIGGLAGFASANVDSVLPLLARGQSALGSSYAAVVAALPSWPEKEIAASCGGNTVLTKKPIKVASVQVADASGTLNSPIPLDLSALPANAEIPIALKITGLPADAYLTKGKEISDGEWMLMSNEIEGVKLVVPQAQSPQLDLSVAAVEQATGTVAAPPREMTVELDINKMQVVPANAPPDSQTSIKLGTGVGLPLPQAIPLPQEDEASSEARSLFEKGEVHLKTGDLVAARQFFIKAHGLGMSDAAFKAGQTFDPLFFQKMNVRGLDPNRGKALEWYDKAAKAGSAEAAEAAAKLSETAAP